MQIENHANARQWASQNKGLREFNDVCVDETGNIYLDATPEAILNSVEPGTKVYIVKQNGTINMNEVLLAVKETSKKPKAK